jgi:hypothetical protein
MGCDPVMRNDAFPVSIALNRDQDLVDAKGAAPFRLKCQRFLAILFFFLWCGLLTARDRTQVYLSRLINDISLFRR